ncbi:DUF6596 domain-containing protein [Galbibacter sp. PAP.153]|uniref:DUF6596 domain-containing protein n=1 Tax=Galbibacter sp. PAP.153 TaxID=3104623 RepID=UPI003008D26E
MNHDDEINIEGSYRAYYGKLYASLLHHFGKSYIPIIENAIQNTFLKALRQWKHGRIPENKLGWLFIVAKNDLLNQIKKEAFQINYIEFDADQQDYRLEVLYYIIKATDIPKKAKTLFILKNIFGLHIKEISASTLLGEEAIYKNIQRTRKRLQKGDRQKFPGSFSALKPMEITLVAEVLYGVFNIGYDAVESKSFFNYNVCLEAYALTKTIKNQHADVRIKHLLSLFFFHIARFGSRMAKGKMISFFDQDKSLWNQSFINAGFHYLEKPDQLNQYYIEALIVSSYMMENNYDEGFWNKMLSCYKLLQNITDSPILQLNVCYCLMQLNQEEDAIKIIEKVEPVLRGRYYYFELVKASLYKKNKSELSKELFLKALNNVSQPVRKQYILEHFLLE